MEEDERPRKLQKFEHDKSNETNIMENSESFPLGVLENGDELVKDQQHTISAPPIETSEDQSNENEQQHQEEGEGGDKNGPTITAPTPMSKKQQKRLIKMQKWEYQKEERRKGRREKRLQRNERKREMRRNGELQEEEKIQDQKARSILLPVTFVIDCGWDDLMSERERISLASQVTRSYSDNSRGRFRSHLVISSFDKLLKERFDTVLFKSYERWKGVHLMQEDFVHAAEQAKNWMQSPGGGQFAGALKDAGDASPEDGEVIYLSGDSPNILTELKPYSTYIIGGLVDKNRHKGICYRKATELGIKTAKLPIGDYLHMTSRTILATSHVIEIMVKWLELGDWGEAFMKVIPPRKIATSTITRAGKGYIENGDGEDKEVTDEVNTSTTVLVDSEDDAEACEAGAGVDAEEET